MRILSLSLREFRANWRRNAVFGAILLVAITVQLFTALSATASSTAVESYGTAVFGYAATYSSSLEQPLSPAQLAAFNDRLEAVGRAYPWFRPATAVDVQGYLRVSPDRNPAEAVPVTLRAVSPTWRELTPSIADSDVWRTVTSTDRLGAGMILETSVAHRLGISAPRPVTILVNANLAAQPAAATATTAPQATGPPPGDGRGGVLGGPPERQGGDAVGARVAVQNVPLFGFFTEPNKSLSVDAIVSQNLLALTHAGPQPIQLYWRCAGSECRDAYGLIRAAAAAVGTRPGPEQRLDQIDQFRPILDQQRRDGQRFAAIVVLLAALAVAIVATAFVEVRAPQFATMRALGASRSAVAAIALLENLFTASLAGVFAVGLGLAASGVDPNRFNQIPQVYLSHLAVPVALYAQTVALTLAIGLLTGLAPAVRAYRSVRTT